MNIHPAIAALRTDPEHQSLDQKQFLAALSVWQSHGHTDAIAHDLDSFGAGEDLANCAMLDRLLSDHVSACAFIQIWQRSVIGALREHPLADLSFQHRSSEAIANMVLTSSGRAALSVVVYEQREGAAHPQSAVFSDRQTHECVIKGSANGVLHEVRRCDGVDTIIDTCNAHWRAGAVIVTKGPCEARQVVAVDGAMVVLQLSRSAAAPQPTREYKLEDGELIKSVSGDKLASQKVMALGVLGALAVPSGLDAMRQCALDLCEDLDVRWEAVRQTLALDPARGIALLDAIGSRDADLLSEPACELRTALKESQPELAHLFGAAA